MERIIEERTRTTVWERVLGPNNSKGIEGTGKDHKLKVKDTPNEAVQLKESIVACGNMDESEDTKETYAGCADAAAVRSAIRIAARRR